MTTGIEVVLLENPECLCQYQSQWSAVVSQSENALHCSPYFIRAWWRSFGSEGRVVCVLVLRNQDPIAAIPLIFSEKRLGPVRLPYCRLLGNNFSPRSDLAVLSDHREVFKQLVSILTARRVRWIDIGWVPESTSSSALSHMTDCGWNRLLIKHLELPIVSFNSNWSGWLAQKSRTFRKSLRSAASNSAGYGIESFSGNLIDVDRLVTLVEHVSQRSWSHQSGSSFVSSEAERDFVRNLLRSYAERGCVVASVLVDDTGEAAAFALGFKVGRSVYGFKTAYRQDLTNASLGTHVMATFIELCASLEVDCVDMDCITTRGDYKRRWCNRVETTESWRFFDARPTSQAIRLLYASLNFCRKLMKNERLSS